MNPAFRPRRGEAPAPSTLRASSLSITACLRWDDAVTPVEQQLRGEIAAADGRAISFARFMEVALYAPGVGYYSRPDRAIGRGGDFYTSVSVGPVFGFLLAHRFARWCQGWDQITLVEAGAHDGRLAADVLSALGEFHPEVLARTRYEILEPLPNRAANQRRTLASWGDRIAWRSGWEELPTKLNGVIFSNELLDAFPIRRFVWEGAAGRWAELGVTAERGAEEAAGSEGTGFHWCRLAEGLGAIDELAEEIRQPVGELAAAIPDGFITEVGRGAEAWWRTAAERLDRGWLVALDYGFETGEALRPNHPEGTLRSYRSHRLSPDPLAHPGEQDLTAHVDFARLRIAGESLGLRTEGAWPQGRWLGGIAAEVLQRGGAAADWLTARARQLQTLTHPTHLGQAMKALVQSRSS